MYRSRFLPESITPKEAVALQRELAREVRFKKLPPPRSGMLIAGVDCSYQKIAISGYAAVVVCKWPSLDVVEVGRSRGPVSFPYVPGLLSFRELPLLWDAWDEVENKPELVVVDGQGIAHPRRIGLASHLGLAWRTPTIGCAKSLLIGGHRLVREKKGSQALLKDKGQPVGAVVRTREGVKPVYVSPGHLCEIETAVRWILRLTPRYRIPEVIRLAHREVNRTRREAARIRD